MKTIDLRFETELSMLINRFSLENGSDTPDFILAEYMRDCLAVFNKTIEKREAWYGRENGIMPSLTATVEINDEVVDIL